MFPYKVVTEPFTWEAERAAYVHIHIHMYMYTVQTAFRSVNVHMWGQSSLHTSTKPILMEF